MHADMNYTLTGSAEMNRLAALWMLMLSLAAAQGPARSMAERRGRLQPGDAAPSFDLPIRGAQQRVKLSSFQGQKPVALIFGSYT